MSKELSQNKEAQVKNELFKKYNSLAEKLLKPAEQINDVWKRAMYPIPQEKTEVFYNDLVKSNLAELLSGHINPDTDSEYIEELPYRAYILVEDIDHTKAAVPRGYKATDLEIGLHYETEAKEFNDLRIVLTLGKTQATSYIYSSEQAETGYEGHDWRMHPLTIDQLQSFYNAIKKNTKS